MTTILRQTLVRRLASCAAVSHQKLVCPRQHVWFRSVVAHPQSPSSAAVVRIELGLTQHGLDRLGDVTKIVTSSTFGDGLWLECGDTLLSIEWEGHCISSADELYHTVWDNVEGSTPIVAPLSCRLVGAMSDDDEMDFNTTEMDEDDVVATLEATADEWQRQAAARLISMNEYNQQLLQAWQPTTPFSKVEGLV